MVSKRAAFGLIRLTAQWITQWLYGSICHSYRAAEVNTTHTAGLGLERFLTCVPVVTFYHL